MAFYQRIKALQEPFDLGLDEKERSKVQFNIMAIKEPSATFLEEICKYLEIQGVGIRATNIFASTKSSIPAGVGPYLSVIESGGTGPKMEQDSDYPAFQQPTAVIVARGGDYVAARTMARAAYDALVVVKNQTLTT
jgi:hypothetical protein